MSIYFDRLYKPFPPDRVSWRVGSTTGDKSRGLALAYIDARDVMERLDEAVGPLGWQNRYPHANGKTVCEIGLKIVDEWIWKADGAGDTDFEAEKGALSDAFKRAAVRWGIGRYLYEIPSPWVAIQQHGKSYSIADSELPKLSALLKAHFIADYERAIARFTDAKELGAWWNSEAEKADRRAFGLEPAEVTKLKDMVIARMAELDKPKAAA